jgi:ADP-heptose:LPS heptosyltransferase
MTRFTRLKKTPALIASLARNRRRLADEIRQAAQEHKTLTLIILTGRLGDLIAAQSILPALASPTIKILWLAKPAYADILIHNPAIAGLIPVTAATEALILRRLYPRQRWINLHLDQSQCADFNLTIRNPNPHKLDITNFYDFGTLADVYSLLATGRAAPAGPTIHLPELDLPTLLSTLFTNPSAQILVFHPVSEESEKSWPACYAQSFAAWLLRHTDCNIFEPGLTPILRPCPRIAAPGRTLTLAQQAAVTRHATFFIGVDSAFAHLANAYAIPSVLLIGRYRNFTTHLPCRPNPHDILLRTNADLAAIPPNHVIKAIATLLDLIFAEA